MEDSQNNITTYSIFSKDNKEGKNQENCESNMDIEELQENKDNSKIDEIKLDEIDKEEESKKEPKEKRRVRGPNKCYRIIDQFFGDKKRAKIVINSEEKSQSKNANDINEEEEKKVRRRIKQANMIDVFDEFLNYVQVKVNETYYNNYIIPIINNYKEFYIEKEKEYKENKNSSLNINNIEDENLIKKKRIYYLENILEIPEILNDYVKHIYNKNIFKTNEAKIEMIEIIYIFCAWLKQNHYTSYNIEYLLKDED